MKRFQKTSEPSEFDAKCRQRGLQWLSEHPEYDRPMDYWCEFEDQLHEAFGGLCSYCVMLVMRGHIDHFIPVNVLKREKRDAEAYEWLNFRYADGFINQKKRTQQVLDPFLVEDHWFELHLPSLQLTVTDTVPDQYRELAKFTLRSLGLDHSAVVLRYRRRFFEMWQRGKLPLEGLDEVAPLIAAAIRRTGWKPLSTTASP